ncbi:MAG: SDR family NAD(P)-dependent oxidoreductase [Parvibaculum sp.]|uniref:SDR family NAD(P)-dependent oxidoreductase n=1 Tax=Parvibaculum sp. TaxID=2024848 RepID=UPI0025F69206|nr:SDR family NAD(P)-dependent oxidoreductase [Parvibaculum sp.]MCE9650562.1 SDR family NAD(P)-dependent oxidoreductase [Parvibaculum sp.]
MDLQLAGRTALVTGSHRGTGRAIAETLAREGARVVVHGFADAETRPVVDDIVDAGGDACGVAGDIMSDEGAKAVFHAAVKAVGPIDILINNYGTADAGSWTKSETADWIDAYEKNVLSAVRLTRLAMAAMKERRWGRIVMLGTIGSTEPAARMPHYYASKGALATMTISLAKELAGTGITVNIVSPGLIRTKEVEDRFLAQGREKGWGATWDEIEPHVLKNFIDNLTGKVTKTQEVADLVAFVASPRAGALMALNLRIDGGTTALVV